MDDLVTFLRDRLDEDEQLARTAASSGAEWPDAAGEVRTAELAHARRHDPARVLRDVDAARRIIDWAIDFMEGDYAPWNETCLELLALSYADHPDYRAEWVPEPRLT